MKKEKKVNFVEIGSFFVCLIIILAIAYFCGYLKGFSVNDFGDTYKKVTSDLANSSFVKNTEIKLSKTGTPGKEIPSYEGYQPVLIPEAVLRGSKSTHSWEFLFNSSTKTIFYTYSNTSEGFESSIRNYLSIPKNSGVYSAYSYTEKSLSKMHVGDIGSSKICNSLQECNEQRQKALDYSSLAEFIKYCGNTMCVINSKKGEYIKLKMKDSGQAVKMLNDLRSW